MAQNLFVDLYNAGTAYFNLKPLVNECLFVLLIINPLHS